MQLGLQAAESSATRSSSKLSTLEPERNLPGDPLSAELGAEDLTPADTRVTEAARRAAQRQPQGFRISAATWLRGGLEVFRGFRIPSLLCASTLQSSKEGVGPPR